MIAVCHDGIEEVVELSSLLRCADLYCYSDGSTLSFTDILPKKILARDYLKSLEERQDEDDL